MTRKLTIRTKLAAALAVPLVALATFAALQVRGSYDRADQVKRQAALATAATGPAGLLAALETERDYQALWEIGAQDLVDPQLQTSGDATSRTNQALLRFRQQVLERGSDTSGNYTTTLASVSGRLSQLRKDAQAHASNAASAAGARHANDIFDRYTTLIGQLLDADQRSAHTIDDAVLRSGAELLNAIARENDVEKRIAVKGILATVSHDAATVSQVQRLAGVQAAGEAELRVRADGPYGRAILSTLTAKDRATITAKLQAVANDPLHVNTKDVFKTASTAASLWRVPQTNTANVVSERAQKLTSDAQAEQRDWVIVTIASVLLAIAMLWLANKWITRPLRSLAEQAGTMAGDRLPAAVQEILAARRSEDVIRPDVEPVRVRAGGEVREVAVALNKVQDSAIGLAVEQARLRGNVADAFVNLGRRNQNLLSRQLEFITHLENDESDPETLEHLFRLDHLATRMRRNAESLLVLAGHEPPRTWSGPVEIGDVVRGALGEVEGYRRVRLRHIDDARVDGSAAVDVSHVIAELVENALSFSPPDADVEVYGRRDEFGYLLTIVDQGIGMPADQLERANELISSPETGTFAASRFLGHYVVAQLAARHGLGVHLAASPLGGITAMIALPAALLGETAPPQTAPHVLLADEHEPERPDVALPRREPAPDLPVRTPLVFSAPPRREVTLEVTPDVEAARLAPAYEPPDVAADPEPEPRTPEPPVAPVPPKPRVGLGTFADLRATQPSPARPAQTAPPVARPVAPPASPAPLPEASPDAARVEETPDRLPAGARDRAAAFAEVAHAVDTVAGIAPSSGTPSPVLSEDLLPQRLPKRGRRSSRLAAPWSREKPAKPAIAPPPASAAPDMRAPAPPAHADVDAHGRVMESPATRPASGSAVHFPPGGPPPPVPPADAHPVDEQPPASRPEPPAPNTDGDNRFAFFAAFRAAAEQAREEAGIDNRRTGK
ncbi:MAG TPA: ATP-binding protein [Acidimicrobiia bacterium]|nr:ATP-binding protein [Acidimicrobiia bacterium]